MYRSILCVEDVPVAMSVKSDLINVKISVNLTKVPVLDFDLVQLYFCIPCIHNASIILSISLLAFPLSSIIHGITISFPS